MYNEDVKIKFIKETAKSENTIYQYERLFRKIEPFELEWGADFCTRSKEEITPVIEAVVGLKSSGNCRKINMLKKYVNWCLVNKVENACNSIFNAEIKVVGIDKIRKQMVSSPLQMHKYLCDVFPETPYTTIDDIYRGLLWLAFFGLDIEEAMSLKTSDVDVDKRIIYYRNGEKKADIYPYAVKTFENLQSPTIVCRKEEYKESSRVRERLPGDLLLRSFRNNMPDNRSIQNRISVFSRHAFSSGKTDKQLSYHRAQLSGIFCRAYEVEEAYGEVDFSELVLDDIRDRTFKDGNLREIEIAAMTRNYNNDYNKWKFAFNKIL